MKRHPPFKIQRKNAIILQFPLSKPFFVRNKHLKDENDRRTFFRVKFPVSTAANFKCCKDKVYSRNRRNGYNLKIDFVLIKKWRGKNIPLPYKLRIM